MREGARYSLLPLAVLATHTTPLAGYLLPVFGIVAFVAARHMRHSGQGNWKADGLAYLARTLWIELLALLLAIGCFDMASKAKEAGFMKLAGYAGGAITLATIFYVLFRCSRLMWAFWRESSPAPLRFLRQPDVAIGMNDAIALIRSRHATIHLPALQD